MNRKYLYKDMERYRRTRNKQKRRYYGKTANASNRGQPWTAEDIEIVVAHKLSDTQISELIGRSVASIQQRRHIEKQKRCLK